MNTKLTRRAVLGTVIGGLAVAPFAMWSLRRPKQLELGSDSYLAKFREEYQTALDLPRTFDPFSEDNLIPHERHGFQEYSVKPFRDLPRATQDRVISIQKRYWGNYVKLDEAEFDYTFFGFEKDGKKMSGNFYMSAHVRLKYGYGMEIKGTNVTGEPIHWVFNMDGGAALPAAENMNLSSMFRSFFDVNNALPSAALLRWSVEDSVELPQNPYIKGDGLYDMTDGDYDRLDNQGNRKIPLILRKDFYNRTYFSQKTGMPELVVHSAIPDAPFDKYMKGKIKIEELPPPRIRYTSTVYTSISGVYIPTEHTNRYCEDESGMPRHRQTYSNIKIKLLS